MDLWPFCFTGSDTAKDLVKFLNLNLDKLKLFERSHEEAKKTISKYPLIKLSANVYRYAVKPEEAAVNYTLQLVYNHALNISEIGYRKEAYQLLKVFSKIDILEEDREAREAEKKLKNIMSAATVLALPFLFFNLSVLCKGG